MTFDDMTTQQILIIEDDPAIANTLRYSLEREGWQVAWLATANQALSALASFSILSAIVMDIGLPDIDGFSLCQKIRFGQHHNQVPILFLTARNDEIDKIIGLEMGADDYITKPFSPREVVARLKAIWRRETMYQHIQDVSQKTTRDFTKKLPTGVWQYQDNIYQLSWNGSILNLSKTELSIMLTLLNQPTHILSRDQILSAISDYPEHRLARTIDSHIKTLRHKLAEIQANCDVIVTHRGLGYGLNQQVV